MRTPRGGKLTYHGPGQLVGYPIMRARDIPAFVRAMEARDRRRARRGGDRGARPRPRGPAVHGRLGRGPQDRLDRRPRLARRQRARVRGQRRQRRRAVPPGHRLRAARRADDVGRARDRPRRRAARASASAPRTPSRRRTGMRQRIVAPARLGRARTRPRVTRRACAATAPDGASAASPCAIGRGRAAPRHAAARARRRGRVPASAAAASAASGRLEPPGRDLLALRRARAPPRASRCSWRGGRELLGDAREPAPLRARVVLPLTPRPRAALRYVTADLDPGQGRPACSTSARSTCPTRRSSAIICSHVLEHVDRDRDALGRAAPRASTPAAGRC